jgi:hypothetical protein
MRKFRKNSTENQNTHFLFNKPFFSRNSCLFWDNVGKYCRSGQATEKWRMRVAWWILKVTNTHSEYTYVLLIAVQLQKVLHERAQCYVTRTLPLVLMFNVFSDKQRQSWGICSCNSGAVFFLLETAFKYYLHVLQATKFKDEKRWFGSNMICTSAYVYLWQYMHACVLDSRPWQTGTKQMRHNRKICHFRYIYFISRVWWNLSTTVIKQPPPVMCQGGVVCHSGIRIFISRQANFYCPIGNVSSCDGFG